MKSNLAAVALFASLSSSSSLSLFCVRARPSCALHIRTHTATHINYTPYIEERREETNGERETLLLLPQPQLRHNYCHYCERKTDKRKQKPLPIVAIDSTLFHFVSLRLFNVKKYKKKQLKSRCKNSKNNNY